MNMAATYSPGKIPVPSAMRGLTSLFGMGRGEHPRQYHHKTVCRDPYTLVYKSTNNIRHIRRKQFYKRTGQLHILLLQPGGTVNNKVKAYGQLVLLGFDVTTFTPVAYQRHRL